VLSEDLHHIVDERPKCPGCDFAEETKLWINSQQRRTVCLLDCVKVSMILART
jgi:hypothetical protein